MTDLSRPQSSATAFTPVSSDAREIELRAYYFPSPIDLNQVQSHYPPANVLSADPLVLNMPGDVRVAVLRFGVVVFWHHAQVVCDHVLRTVQQVMKGNLPYSEAQDRVLVLVNQPEERVNFRDIRLPSLTLEHIRIISETFGQSIALKQCELSVNQALKNTAPIVQALEARGELMPSQKNILRTVGFTLAVREAILAKLGLFDDPAETWQSETIARLHGLLHSHFDIKQRLSGLHEKVTFLSDLSQMLLTLLQNRTSHRLEWVVILLIVIEVIFSFIHFFSPGH